MLLYLFYVKNILKKLVNILFIEYNIHWYSIQRKILGGTYD